MRGFSYTVIQGNELNRTVPDDAKITDKHTGAVNITFSGKNGCDMSDTFSLSDSLLSQHLLVVGGIGSGKTNALNIALDSLTGRYNVSSKLGSNDVMVIFDTKGDFKTEFYRPGDVVISNGPDACGPGKVDYWNMVSELQDDAHLKENIIEICNALFAHREKNSEDQFFTSAAKALTGALLYHAVQERKKTPYTVNNAFILKLLSKDPDELREIVGKYSAYKYVLSYFPKDAVEQSMAVIAEMQQVLQPILVGNFGKGGTLSIRNLVKAKGGRRIFIEYDIGVGSMLTPIYTLLFDLAIKEALCRSRSEGNVFMIADEFKLLPNLQHIDDAVNFGRSLGMKFMIGIQNVDQIIETYGKNRAMNIFSGFMNHWAFSVSDYNTRRYVRGRAGENRQLIETSTHEVKQEITKGSVVEDWDLQNLAPGECVVMLNRRQPFLFQFDRYVPAPPRR